MYEIDLHTLYEYKENFNSYVIHYACIKLTDYVNKYKKIHFVYNFMLCKREIYCILLMLKNLLLTYKQTLTKSIGLL